jgi:hypothetical protein
MGKNNPNQNEHLSLKRKTAGERLEISSTGYGLESVSETEEDHTIQETNTSNPSCGGL